MAQYGVIYTLEICMDLGDSPCIKTYARVGKCLYRPKCRSHGITNDLIPNGIYRISANDLKQHTEHLMCVGVGDWHDNTHVSDRERPGLMELSCRYEVSLVMQLMSFPFAVGPWFRRSRNDAHLRQRHDLWYAC